MAARRRPRRPERERDRPSASRDGPTLYERAGATRARARRVVRIRAAVPLAPRHPPRRAAGSPAMSAEQVREVGGRATRIAKAGAGRPLLWLHDTRGNL